MNKIVFVIGATKSGGAEKRAILISKVLRPEHETKVFAFHGENNGDIDFVYSPTYSEYKQTSKTKRINSLKKYLVKEKPDFVFSFVPHINYFTTRALKTKELKNTKHIVCLAYHDFKFPVSLLIGYSMKKADAIYYQCNEQRELLPCKKYSFVLANPIEIPEFLNKNVRYKMMSVGRLEDQKNYETMIKAFELISIDIPDATLDIYGSGSKKNELLQLIDHLNLEDRVFIHDYVQDISEKYKTHDIFLFTTKHEGFPNALAEAMANNLICFTTLFKTGCKELMVDKETGFVCCDNSFESFAKMVIDNLKNYENASNVAKNGYNHINDICNISLFKEKLLIELEILKNGKNK